MKFKLSYLNVGCVMFSTSLSIYHMTQGEPLAAVANLAAAGYNLWLVLKYWD